MAPPGGEPEPQGEGDELEQAVSQQLGISEIFYWFQQYTTLGTGRTLGRKIGVVQEIILRRYFESIPSLLPGMCLERRLVGKSGAGHKVEFAWFRHEVAEMSVGDTVPGFPEISVTSVLPRGSSIGVTFAVGDASVRVRKGHHARDQHRLRNLVGERMLDFRVHSISADSATLVVFDYSRLLASLESKRVGAQRFAASDNLGSGIQTIEKAKQSALVAIDLDLMYNATLKVLSQTAEPRPCLNALVLGNGVHWTAKDKMVLGTYLDCAFLVDDQAIIRYAEHVRELADAAGDEFLAFFNSHFSSMTKPLKEDGFQVDDSDFTIVTPESETRSLGDVLTEHIIQYNTAIDG